MTEQPQIGGAGQDAPTPEPEITPYGFTPRQVKTYDVHGHTTAKTIAIGVAILAYLVFAVRYFIPWSISEYGVWAFFAALAISAYIFYFLGRIFIRLLSQKAAGRRA